MPLRYTTTRPRVASEWTKLEVPAQPVTAARQGTKHRRSSGLRIRMAVLRFGRCLRPWTGGHARDLGQGGQGDPPPRNDRAGADLTREPECRRIRLKKPGGKRVAGEGLSRGRSFGW